MYALIFFGIGIGGGALTIFLAHLIRKKKGRGSFVEDICVVLFFVLFAVLPNVVFLKSKAYLRMRAEEDVRLITKRSKEIDKSAQKTVEYKAMLREAADELKRQNALSDGQAAAIDAYIETYTDTLFTNRAQQVAVIDSLLKTLE